MQLSASEWWGSHVTGGQMLYMEVVHADESNKNEVNGDGVALWDAKEDLFDAVVQQHRWGRRAGSMMIGFGGEVDFQESCERT